MRNKKTIAVFLILLVAGGVIVGSHLYLTSFRYKETLLHEEIDKPFAGWLRYGIYFNLTIPTATPYIQFIFNGTDILSASCRLHNSDGVQVWFSPEINSPNYSSSWIQVVPGDYLIDIDYGVLMSNLTVLGRSALTTQEQDAEILSFAGTVVGLALVGLGNIVLIFQRYDAEIQTRWRR
jgi:hypothetical protein